MPWRLSGNATSSSLRIFKSSPIKISFYSRPIRDIRLLASARKVGFTLSKSEIGRSYRALARERNGHYYWFWIGTHEQYNQFQF
jgi:hypothetical protein